MKLPVRNAEGQEVRVLEVDDSVFGLEPNTAVLHQAFVAQRANQRWGTAQTKTRGQVQGSTRKIRPQKYTGRARQGSIRAPHRVGGGIAFGPQQRDYSQALPKKMRRLAIRSALSGKVAHGQLAIIDHLSFDRPKTQEMARILRNLGLERSALIVTDKPDKMVLASARNLEKAKVLPASYLNVVDLLAYHDALMTEGAVRVAEGLWGQRKPSPDVAPEATVPRRRPARRQSVAEETQTEPSSAGPAPEEGAPGQEPQPRRRARRSAPPAGEA